MSDYTPQPGDRVRVQIDVEGEYMFSGWVRIANGVECGPRWITSLNATITRIDTPEPPVGSVWLDADGVTIVHERFDTPSPSRWWVASTGPWLTWAQVQARGGSLLHDAGTVQP